MKLIVGLGNPGKEYLANRHNIGFLCVNQLAKQNNIILDKKQGKARVGTGIIGGIPVILAKPQTYMNASGLSVISLLEKYKLSPDDLIVIHDDLDLPSGKIRIRSGSGAAGHKGIKSIIGSLGTQDFTRVRIGISRPEIQEDTAETVVDFVLGDFDKGERTLINQTIQKISEVVVSLLTEDLVAAMNKFN